MIHCQDKSDETNCAMVIFPEYYDKLLPPTKLEDYRLVLTQTGPTLETLTDLEGTFRVLDLLDVNEIDSTFDLYFKLNLKWYDVNLKYRFLNDLEDKNAFNQSDLTTIWRPDIQFIHVENNDGVIKFGETIFVRKGWRSPLLSAGMDSLSVSEIYEGSHHSINILMKRKMKFSCPFDNIKNYPFGIQKCSLHFYVSGVANGLTKLDCRILHPKYKSVGQYVVREWTLLSGEKDGENVVTVTMTLERTFSSIFMVTYLPTVS